MSNIKNTSTRNIVFLCNICEKNFSDKDDAIHCDMSGLDTFKMYQGKPYQL